MIGLVICTLEFFGYLYIQYASSLPPEEQGTKSHVDLLKDEVHSFIGKIKAFLARTNTAPAPLRATMPSELIERAREIGIKQYMAEFRNQHKLQQGDKEGNRKLLEKVSFDSNFKGLLKYFYGRYSDPTSRQIHRKDFQRLCSDLHLSASEKVFTQVDTNSDDGIDCEEFVECFKALAAFDPVDKGTAMRRSFVVPKTPTAQLDDHEAEEEEEEVEEVPEEFKDLPVEEQRRRILAKSLYKMSLGTLLVLIVSDPMVEVLGEIGKQTGIPAFYISFVLAPLASNSSEFVAAYNYAQKKTSKTITISLNTLEGAACMNNTFCLGIFLALVYFQGLAWKFTAETIAILFVQFVVAVIVLSKSIQRVFDGLLILTLMPGSLALVYFLENHVGLD